LIILCNCSARHETAFFAFPAAAGDTDGDFGSGFASVVFDEDVRTPLRDEAVLDVEDCPSPALAETTVVAADELTIETGACNDGGRSIPGGKKLTEFGSPPLFSAANISGRNCAASIAWWCPDGIIGDPQPNGLNAPGDENGCCFAAAAAIAAICCCQGLNE